MMRTPILLEQLKQQGSPPSTQYERLTDSLIDVVTTSLPASAAPSLPRDLVIFFESASEGQSVDNVNYSPVHKSQCK
jgi:hypothetical protein